MCLASVCASFFLSDYLNNLSPDSAEYEDTQGTIHYICDIGGSVEPLLASVFFLNQCFMSSVHPTDIVLAVRRAYTDRPLTGRQQDHFQTYCMGRFLQQRVARSVISLQYDVPHGVGLSHCLGKASKWPVLTIMLCCVILCYAMLCYSMLLYFMFCYAMLCYVICVSVTHSSAMCLSCLLSSA